MSKTFNKQTQSTNIRSNIIWKILLIALLTHISKSMPINDDDEQYNYIIRTQKIGNKVVEESELIHLHLSDYYSGSLLEYSVELLNLNDLSVVEGYLSKLIYLSKPFTSLSSIYINNSTFQNQLTPFPRSTILDDHDGLISLVFLDKNLNLQRYDVTLYSQGIINHVYSIPLNQTLVNGSCSDLNKVMYYEMALLLFCKSYNTTDPNKITLFDTIVKIEQYYSDEPIIRYISYVGSQIYTEDTEYKFMRLYFINETGIISTIANFLMKLEQQTHGNYPMVVGINMTVFEDMKKSNITELVNYKAVYISVAQVSVDFDSTKIEIIDFVSFVQYPNIFINFLLQDYGLIICNFSINDFIPKHIMSYLTCDEESNNIKQIEISNPVSVYYDEQIGIEKRIFVPQSLPPGVVEINIENTVVPYIYKTYKIPNDDSNKYVGLSTIAVNNNYIVHLLYEVQTSRQVLRVYCRNSTYFNLVKFDFTLPRLTQSNFIAFPNYYLNLIIFRDEVKINMTQFDDYKLIINATDLNIVQKALYEKIQVNLTIYHDIYQQNWIFNVTFVEKNNTDIQSAVVNDFQFDILYNCGDDSFQYIIQDYYNGPFYKLKAIDNNRGCDDGSCFFSFVNQNFSKIHDYNHNFENCTKRYLYPYLTKNKAVYNDRNVLICINEKTSTITSYSICYNCIVHIKLTNSIQIPYTKFLKYGHDQEQGFLFIISIPEGRDEYFSDYQQIHFFAITHLITWKSMKQPFFGSQAFLDNIESFEYNPNWEKGIIVDKVNSNYHQYLVYFGIKDYNYATITAQYLDVSQSGEIKKASLANDRFIYAVVNMNQIIVLEGQSILTNKFAYMWKVDFGTRTIYDFGVYIDKYIVVYFYPNIMEVWEIEMNIYLQFKMYLPLYGFYSNLAFDNQDYSSILKYYYDEYLTIVMQMQVDNQTEYHMIVYSFRSSQHNAFIMAQNLTDVLSGATQQSINMKGNQFEESEITLITENKYVVFQSRFENAITLGKTKESKQLLIKNCSGLTEQVTLENNGVLPFKQIGTLKIAAVSLLNQTQSILNDSDLSSITINIMSQNQGLAIIPTDTHNISIGMSNDVIKNGEIALQTLLEGQNLNFTFRCHYHDEYGTVEDCKKFGIIDQSQSTPYIFYIEFVTAQSHVLKSISAEKIFFMMDSQGYLNLMRIPYELINMKDQKSSVLDLEPINGYPLDSIYVYNQNEIIGCTILSKAVAPFYLGYIDVENPFKLYIVVYQCNQEKDTMKLLKVAVVKFYEDQEVDWVIFDDYLELANNLIDVELVKIYLYDEYLQIISVAFTTEITGSFTNTFHIYDMSIDSMSNQVAYTLRVEQTAEDVNKDTFDVTQLIMIPNSDIMIIVNKNTGFYLYDTLTYTFLTEFNLYADNIFREQSVQQVGKLQVFNAVGNWPYSIHILTNQGIFIYRFDVDLTVRDQIFPYYDKTLKPKNKRILRVAFDEFNQEVASNAYGYAFLVKIYTQRNEFDVYLGAISYYSSMNSKLFKMFLVSKNQDCNSLNNEAYLQSSEEDQLAVSFVCNSQVMIYRICLRPNILIDMMPYNSTSTRSHSSGNKTIYTPGIMQYNQFQIEVRATNSYILDGVNIGLIFLNLEFQNSLQSFNVGWLGPINFLIILLITMVTLIIFKITFHSNTCDHDKEQNFIRQFTRDSTSIKSLEDDQKKRVVSVLAFDQIQTENLKKQDVNIKSQRSYTTRKMKSENLQINNIQNFGLQYESDISSILDQSAILCNEQNDNSRLSSTLHLKSVETDKNQRQHKFEVIKEDDREHKKMTQYYKRKYK